MMTEVLIHRLKITRKKRIQTQAVVVMRITIRRTMMIQAALENRLKKMMVIQAARALKRVTEAPKRIVMTMSSPAVKVVKVPRRKVVTMIHPVTTIRNQVAQAPPNLIVAATTMTKNQAQKTKVKKLKQLKKTTSKLKIKMNRCHL